MRGVPRLAGARVIVVGRDPVTVDHLTDTLRGLGAEVGVGGASLDLQRLRTLDPQVLVHHGDDFGAEEIREAIARTRRLSGVLRVCLRGSPRWPEGFEPLLRTIEAEVQTDLAIAERARQERRFEVDVERHGGGRLLRALIGASEGVCRVTLDTPGVTMRIEVGGDLVLGASVEDPDGEPYLQGKLALEAAMGVREGTATIEQIAYATDLSITAPMALALEDASVSTPPSERPGAPDGWTLEAATAPYPNEFWAPDEPVSREPRRPARRRRAPDESGEIVRADFEADADWGAHDPPADPESRPASVFAIVPPAADPPSTARPSVPPPLPVDPRPVRKEKPLGVLPSEPPPPARREPPSGRIELPTTRENPALRESRRWPAWLASGLAAAAAVGVGLLAFGGPATEATEATEPPEPPEPVGAPRATPTVPAEIERPPGSAEPRATEYEVVERPAPTPDAPSGMKAPAPSPEAAPSAEPPAPTAGATQRFFPDPIPPDADREASDALLSRARQAEGAERMALLHRAATVHPGNPHVAETIAHLALERGDLEMAHAWAQRAVHVRRRRSRYRDLLRRIETRIGEVASPTRSSSR